MKNQSCLLTIIIGNLLLGNAALAHFQGTSITGPFVEGTGHWDTLNNGGFETGDVSGWSDYITIGQGVFRASTEKPFLGQYSAKAIPSSAFNAPGFALQQSVSVQPETTYVLSAFVYTGGTTGNLYLDNWPSAQPWSFADPLDGVEEWQFVYVDLLVPAGVYSENIRMILDANVGAANYGYVDEVALTPKDQFVPPTAVPEPATFLLLVFGGWALLRPRLV